MTLLQALHAKYGIHVRVTRRGDLVASPKPDAEMGRRIAARSSEIIAEIQERHREADELLRRIDRAAVDRTITPDRAFEMALRIARTADATFTTEPPCPACGDTLLWRPPQEEDNPGLPPVCYTCCPPPERIIPRCFESIGGAK